MNNFTTNPADASQRAHPLTIADMSSIWLFISLNSLIDSTLTASGFWILFISSELETLEVKIGEISKSYFKANSWASFSIADKHAK